MNYYDLLNIRYKIHYKVIFLILLIIGLFIFISNKKIYDIYNTYGYIENEVLKLNVPISNPDIINKLMYLKVNDEKCNSEVIDISEVLLDTNSETNYQIVSLKLDKKYYEKQILNISIYYNEEKVSKKLKRIFF